MRHILVMVCAIDSIDLGTVLSRGSAFRVRVLWVLEFRSKQIIVVILSDAKRRDGYIQNEN
jgi:hypothetical protein